MKSIDLDYQQLKAVSLAAARDDICYYLNGVLIDILPRAVRLVATNGHLLACCHNELAAEEDLAPAQIIIPGEVLKGLAPASKAQVMIALRYDDPAEPCTLVGVKGGDRTFTPVDGKFPDYLRVLPNGALDAAGKDLTFDPDYLATFQRMADILAGTKSRTRSHFHLYPNGNGAAPILIPACPDFYGCIMPMRLVAPEWQAPAWLKGGAK